MPASKLPQTNIEALKTAAKGGDGVAQLKLGRYYAGHTKNGEPQDYNPRQAKFWYAKATKNKLPSISAEALNNLGIMMLFERPKRNAKQGVALVERAAERGNRVAQFNLAMWHSEGSLTGKPDEELARIMLSKAAAQGHERAANAEEFIQQNPRFTVWQAVEATRETNNSSKAGLLRELPIFPQPHNERPGL